MVVLKMSVPKILKTNHLCTTRKNRFLIPYETAEKHAVLQHVISKNYRFQELPEVFTDLGP